MAVATIAVNDASPSARLAMRTRRMLPPSRMPPTRAESPPSHTLPGRVKPPHAPETREPGGLRPPAPERSLERCSALSDRLDLRLHHIHRRDPRRGGDRQLLDRADLGRRVDLH